VLGSAGGLDAGGGPVRAPDPEGVLAAVARHYAVTAEELRGTGRARAVALARQVAMYLLREETTASLGQIGRLLGGRDHTTVMHGCARVGEVLASDTRLRDDVAAIRTALLG